MAATDGEDLVDGALVRKRPQVFEALVIDDLGYVQQCREEMEVPFPLLAERYEHRSVLPSSNLPFSQWEQIFRDPMTTVAAIDRLMHHSVIVELNIPSYRLDTAKRAQRRLDVLRRFEHGGFLNFLVRKCNCR